MSTRTNRIITSLIVAFILTTAAPTFAGSIIYVDDDATGANDGSSWEDAFIYLQDALSAAWSGDEIRVAQGTYKPDQGAGIAPGDREATFQLINGVTIKGGYAGFGEPDPDARDIELYETILSGDLLGNDGPNFANNGDNSYHVVTGSNCDQTAIIDGFIITAGNADGPWQEYYDTGGGMYNDSASPTLTNCTFSKNSAAGYGGGICNLFGNPIVTNCTFNANTTTKAGGGMCNINSSPKVTNCTFSGNSANYGGGMYNGYSSNPTVNNCTFTSNSAERGGGICGGRGLINKCTIIGNTAYYGGGLAGYDGVISDSTISGNSAKVDGGCMDTGSNSPTLLNCIISDNTAGNWGGGICNYGDTIPSKSTLISCIVSGNSAKTGGGIFNEENGHAVLRSCILIGNTAELGAAIYSGGWTSATLTNCTLSGNYAENSGGAIFNYDQLTLDNCVLWGNIPDEIMGTTGIQLQNYNNIMGGWPGVGNIDEDPCFVQPGYWDANGTWVDGDYHLMFDSLCINVGDPNYTPEPNETDLDGNPRVMGGRLDMGAYESIKQAFLFRVEPESVIVPEGRTAKFKVSLQSDPKGMVEVAVTHRSGDSDITVEYGEILTFDPSNYSKPQTVTLAAAEDIDTHEGTALIWVDAPGFALVVVKATEEENDETASSILYVNANAAGANDGTCWRDAFTDLQNALTLAAVFPQVEEIRVAKGTYKPDQGLGIKTATFQLIKGVTINGGYAGYGHHGPDVRDIELYETILSGDLRENDDQTLDPKDLLGASCRADNTYHVVTASDIDETAVLDGFTITAGNAKGPWANLSGGGMYNRQSNPQVTNCTFRMNAADRSGGGMCNTGASSPILTNCMFISNSAIAKYAYWGYGGAMVNGSDSNPTLTNCTFINNWALDYGGGMYNVWSSPILINCTFSNNSTVLNHGGGMYNKSSKPSLINCTFSGNSAGNGGGIYSTGASSPTIINCTFSSNFARFTGGGMYSYYGLPILTNCTFIGNASGRNGGGMCNNRCSPALTNCTFGGNYADLGGGIYNNPQTNVSWRSAPKLANCILWANADSNGMDETAQIYDGKPVVNYCCIQGWTGALGGTGNIDADPLFIDPGYWDANGTWVDGDYHLLLDSLCIDAGYNTAVPADITDIDGDGNTTEPIPYDLDGRPRVINSRIDMGAYEYMPSIPAEVDIDPNTLNLNSKGKWITAFILLPEEYNVADIDPNSILLENEIEPERFWLSEDNQIAIAKFSREDVQAILDIGNVELTITGQLTDGTVFEGTDIIKVTDKAGK